MPCLFPSSLAIAAVFIAFFQTACADALPCRATRDAPATMPEARSLYETGKLAESAAAFTKISGDTRNAPPVRLEALAGLERALKAQACDEEAIVVQRERLALAERIGNEQARRQSWARLARLSVTRDSGEAARLANRVLDTRPESGKADDDASDAFTTLALVALGRNDKQAARDLLASALASATTSVRQAEAWRTLGSLRQDDAQYGDAREACLNSLAAATEAADGEARALAQICVAVSLPEAQAKEAVRMWDEVRAQAQMSRMRRVEASVDFEEGWRLYGDQYTTRRGAQQLLLRAAQIDDEIGDRSQERRAQLALATASYGIGDFATAKDAVSRSGDLSRNLGYTIEAAKTEHLLALIALNQMPVDRQTVLVKLQSVLAEIQGTEGRSEQARVLHDMAIVALSDGETGAAQRWLLQAQALLADSQEVDASPVRQKVNVALGWTFLELHLTDTAIPLLRAATAGAPGETRGQAWWGLARVYATYEQPEVARRYYERALREIEPLRPLGRDLPTTASLAFYRNYSSLYREFASLLLRLQQPARAHYVASLMQRRELLEAGWPPTRGGGAEASLPVSQGMTPIDCEQNLAERESAYTKLWYQRQSSPELDSQVLVLQKDLLRSERDCVDSLKKVHNDTAPTVDKSFRDLWENAVGTGARDGATLVVTLLEGDRLNVIVRSRATAGYVVRTRLVRRTAVEDLVAQWQNALQEEIDQRHNLRGEQLTADEERRAEQLRNGVLHQLYSLLFDGFESALLPPRNDGKRPNLVVALDGPLRKVPLAALYDGQHYLGENAAITLLTSTSLTQRQFGDEQPEPGLVLGISRSATPVLLNVEDEVREVALTLHVEPHLDEGASPKLLMDWLNSLNSRDVPALALHIAAHGAIGETESSTVIHLWGGDITARQMTELTQQFAHLRLIVLSSCESAGIGQGDLALGLAGIAGLGARSVIGSLWQVDDEATSKLMSAFYVNWMAQHAKDASRALATAQQQVRDQYKHPFYWAAFITIGRWD